MDNNPANGSNVYIWACCEENTWAGDEAARAAAGEGISIEKDSVSEDRLQADPSGERRMIIKAVQPQPNH
ncbi:MAG: hypothetical protein ACKVS6_10330 [Planctomycetota bacterium]